MGIIIYIGEHNTPARKRNSFSMLANELGNN